MSDVYERLKRPPEDALKKIAGGRLKGMSNITPQWRYEAMTREFRLCGSGWKYTIDKLWTEAGHDGIVVCCALCSVFIKVGDDWSDAIPGIGGSKLVDKESGGYYTNDEGYKMAVTDALSVALRMIGVGADIYRGNFDGVKYRDEGMDDHVDEPRTRQSDTLTSVQRLTTILKLTEKEKVDLYFKVGKDLGKVLEELQIMCRSRGITIDDQPKDEGMEIY